MPIVIWTNLHCLNLGVSPFLDADDQILIPAFSPSIHREATQMAFSLLVII